jgi:nitrile hydratase
MIVCTLCSCYPRTILGLPPLWYKSRAYRTRTVREPRAVLSEFGMSLPDNVEVRVVDSTADCRYLVLPMRPAGTDGWSEPELARLATRDSMIGTAQALSPDGVRG